MQPMDPRVHPHRRRARASRAKLGSAFLVFLLLTNIFPVALFAQTPNTPAPNPQTPDTQKPATPADTQKPATPVTGKQGPTTTTPGGSPTTESLKIETYVERAERKGTVLRLSLKDAMRMALQNNLTIAIQDYSEEIFRSKIFGAAHVYEPHLVTGIGWQSNSNPNTSRFNRVEGADAFTQRRVTWFARTLQNLPYGGNYVLEYANNRVTTFPLSNAALFSSQFGGDILFTFTQPLLRDFRDNQNFHTLKLVKLDDRINDTQFEEQVTAVVKQVQDLYWELVYAIQFQNIRKKSLDLARVQLDNNKRKVEIGILAPIAITEASAEEALRVQDMISSENQINNMENNLKRALSKDRTAEIWNQDIIPTEAVEFKPVAVSMDESITTALQRRPELRRTQLNTEKIDVDYRFYKNQKKPRIDFNGSFGTIGVAGAAAATNPFITQVDPSFAGPPFIVVTQGCGTQSNPCAVIPNPQVPRVQVPNPLFPGDNFIGGLGTLNHQLFGAPYRNYTLGITLDIPLRNRPLEEQLAQLSLQRRQNLKQLKDMEQMVVVDVRNASQAIETNRQVVETAKVGYRLATEQLDAENKRFQAGLSTTFLVLQRQRDLADAEGRLLRAQIDYQKSLNDLQKAKFTTIDQNDMEIAKTQVPANER